MEQYPECSLCTHAARTVTANNQPIKYSIRPSNSDKEFSVGEVITGGGGLFATNSMLYPVKLTETMPEFYYNAPVGKWNKSFWIFDEIPNFRQSQTGEIVF